MKPRLRADWVVFIEVEELWIFEGGRLSPIRRNSVLEELRDKRLQVIQEAICVRAFWGCDRVRCLPESLRDERREKVVCHQHRGGDIMTEMKWEYWEELYTLWRAKHREQSLEERHTVRSARKRSSDYILHRRCEIRGRTEITSWEQSRECQTRMRAEWVKCHGLWCQRQQRDQVDRDKKVFVNQ